MNPSALMYARSTGLIDHAFFAQIPVTLIGAGAVGSNVAPLLPQLGFRRIRVIDPQDVAEENRGCARYGAADVGKKKVLACREHLLMDTPHLTVEVVPAAYAGEPLDGIVVVAVDNREARSKIWQAVRHNPEVHLIVDSRTAGEEGNIYTIRPTNPKDVAFYDTRHPTETAHIPCAESGAPHVQPVVAGLMATQLVRWSRKELAYRWILVRLETLDIVYADEIPLAERSPS